MSDKLNEHMSMMTAMKAQHDEELKHRGREIVELRAGGVARSEASAREEPGTPSEPPVLRVPPVPAIPREDTLAAEHAAVTHAMRVPTPEDGHLDPAGAPSATPDSSRRSRPTARAS